MFSIAQHFSIYELFFYRPYSYPAKSSLYFLRDYETFENLMTEEVPEEFGEDVDGADLLIPSGNGTTNSVAQITKKRKQTYLADLETCK